MKSYIPLETAAIFFLANIFPKKGISSEYVTADFICMGLLGLQGAKTGNYKMKILFFFFYIKIFIQQFNNICQTSVKQYDNNTSLYMYWIE